MHRRTPDELRGPLRLLGSVPRRVVDGRGGSGGAVHPARHAPDAELSKHGVAEVLAVLVDEVVLVPPPFPRQPRRQGPDLLLAQACTAERHRRPVGVLWMRPRRDAGHSGAVVLCAAVAPLAAEHLDPCVKKAAEQQVVATGAHSIDLAQCVVVAKVVHIEEDLLRAELRHVQKLARLVVIEDAGEPPWRRDGWRHGHRGRLWVHHRRLPRGP
mmetsp:Transcript_104122/g.301219  ORF Transcript_104122/g.301219 Transcript_104122/m.301219 type:complete len:213 (-) Transcript_104122:62-700(-)